MRRLLSQLSLLFFLASLPSAIPPLKAQPPSEIEVVAAPLQSLDETPGFYFRESRQVRRNASGEILLLASFCRQLPEEGVCNAGLNLFLLDAEAGRALIREDTVPAGFTLENSAQIFLSNSGEILLAQEDGILRWKEGAFDWLVQQGDSAPGTSSQGSELHFTEFRVSERFARESGSVVFLAKLANPDSLTNQASGIFEASEAGVRKILVEGDIPPGSTLAIPSCALENSLPIAAGALTAFLSNPVGQQQLLLLDDGMDLRIVAESAEPVQGVTIDRFGRFDLNAAGQLAFEGRFVAPTGMQQARLFLFQDSQIRILTRPLSLPGLTNSPILGVSGPFVSDSGEIFFGVSQKGGVGGIFCWRDGRLSKIAADGDPAPGNRIMTVTLGPDVNIRNLQRRYYPPRR